MNFAYHQAVTPGEINILALKTGGVGQFLASHAARRPQHAVVVYEGRTVTYLEMLWRARFLAAQLRQAGIGKGDKVGILFPNHPDYVAAFFGAAEIGAVVIPINPLLKSEEIAHILCDANARAVIVHERGLEEVKGALPALAQLSHVFVVTYAPDAVAPAPPQNAITIKNLSSAQLTELGRGLEFSTSYVAIENNVDLAVLVYTSGTTGKPKGAMLTHANLLSAVHMAHQFLSIDSSDRILAVLPLCHIYGLTIVMLGLLAKGATLVVQEKFEAAATLQLIEREKVTLLPAVPAMYQFMLMELENRTIDLSALRCCLSGAAPLPEDVHERLQKRINAPVVEGYGLTEVSCIATINPVDGVQKKGSVGQPFPGVEIAIIGADRQPLPPGRDNIGEIAIKGPNVMQGYYGKPECTAESLINGWFFTGDLGYLDQDGYLFIAGRTKELILRGGANIYPREIEDVIVRMPEVAEAAVIGVPDQLMGERVKAVVALRPGQTLNAQDVKDFCARHLAEYKVPRLVEFVQSLPRNSTGKVLKRLLQSSL